MARIFEQTFKKSGKEYSVTFDFNDEEIIDNAATFEIKGRVRKNKHEDWEETVIKGEFQFEKRLIVLSHDGKEIAKLDVDTLASQFTNLTDLATDIDHSDIVEGTFVAMGVEKIIHMIPTDPFLGCLIKGAASTVIGRIIPCWYQHRNLKPFSKFAHKIGSCLRDHVPKMLLTCGYRVGRCTVLMGLQ